MRVIGAPIINILYRGKFYFNLALNQVSWVTGKLPELMGALYILERFDIFVASDKIILVIVFGSIGAVIAGWLFKKSGLYDVETYVNAQKNPVSEELLRAARTIEKSFGERKWEGKK